MQLANKSTDEMPISVNDVFTRFAENDYVFTPCTNRFDKWMFLHLWIVPTLILGVDIILAVIISSTTRSFLYVGGHIWLIDEMVTIIIWNAKWLAFPLLGVLAIDALLLRKFVREAPKSLFMLMQAGRFMPGSDFSNYETSMPASPASKLKKRVASILFVIKQNTRMKPRSWQTFTTDFEQALRSRWRLLFSAVFIIAGIVQILSLSGIITNLPVRDWFENEFVLLPFVLWEILFIFIVPVLIGYYVGISLWLLFVVSLYVRWLTPTFTLDIQPSHGDMCGGLKRLGDICLKMAVLCILPAVVFGFWGMVGILQEVVPEVVTGMYLASMVMSVSSFLVFFLPLWRIHRVMVREKARFQDEAVSRIAPIEAKLRDLVTQGGLASNEAQMLDSQLSKLRELYPKGVKYPTWPFDTNILLKLFTPQIVPIITIIVGLADKSASLLEAIIVFFKGLFG